MNTFSASRAATTMAELHAQIDYATTEFERKALHHIGRFGDTDQLLFAEALLSASYLDGSFPACSIPARRAVGRAISRNFKKLKKADRALEFRSVTIILLEFLTSDEQTESDLDGLISKSRRILSRMSSHYSAMVEFQVSANVRHPDGGKLLCPHVHGGIFGHDIGDQAYKVAKQVNARLGALPNGMMPVHVSEACVDSMSLARASHYPSKLPARCKTLYIEPNTGKKNQHESTKGDRMIRYERMLEILSSVPLRHLMFAGGDGRAIKTAALRAAEHVTSLDGSDAERLSSDAIEAFWAKWRAQTNTRRFACPSLIRRGRHHG